MVVGGVEGSEGLVGRWGRVSVVALMLVLLSGLVLRTAGRCAERRNGAGLHEPSACM